jgi:hypothetical protein
MPSATDEYVLKYGIYSHKIINFGRYNYFYSVGIIVFLQNHPTNGYKY